MQYEYARVKTVSHKEKQSNTEVFGKKMFLYALQNPVGKARNLGRSYKLCNCFVGPLLTVKLAAYLLFLSLCLLLTSQHIPIAPITSHSKCRSKC